MEQAGNPKLVLELTDAGYVVVKGELSDEEN